MSRTALIVDKQFTTSLRDAKGALTDRTFGVGEVVTDLAELDGLPEGALENRIAAGFLRATVVEDEEISEEIADEPTKTKKGK